MPSVITNPCALIWPGQKTLFAIAESQSRVVTVADFSSGVLDILRSCIDPVSMQRLDQILYQAGALTTSDKLLAARLLVSPRENQILQFWKGLRVSDCGENFKPYGELEPSVTQKNISSNPLFILDNLFDPECIHSVASWFAAQSFSLSDIDREQTDFSRHWVKNLEAELGKLTAIPLFSWMDATCRSLYPTLKLHLSEAKAYTTLYGDTPTYHRDSEIGPTITAILFAHRNWELDWGGELIICDELGEPHCAIAPRSGRMVAFRGDLLHKAGSPTRLTFDPRQTLVFRYEVQ